MAYPPLPAGVMLLMLLLASGAVMAQLQVFRSGPAQVNTIELYTSEGCSSCPPADAWLSRFKHDPRLWKRVIPMAFHVDYWDYIGWRDRFASPDYSERQRNHQRVGNLDTVYTPGFLVNGDEWRGWFRGTKIPLIGSESYELTLRVDADHIAASLDTSDNGRLVLSIALLGFNLTSDINRGENAGKRLDHDFVVLDMRQVVSDTGRWAFEFPAIGRSRGNKLGIAAWISRIDDLKPLQATGGWLQNQ